MPIPIVKCGLVAAAFGLALPVSSYSQAQDASRISLSDQRQMSRQLEHQIIRCLLFPTASQAGAVKVRVRMNRDGTLADRPTVISASSPANGNAVIRAFVRCITPQEPLKFPVEKYAGWKEFDFTYSPISP